MTKIKEFIGICRPYETPETPEPKIDTGKQHVADSAELWIKALQERGVIRGA